MAATNQPKVIPRLHLGFLFRSGCASFETMKNYRLGCFFDRDLMKIAALAANVANERNRHDLILFWLRAGLQRFDVMCIFANCKRAVCLGLTV